MMPMDTDLINLYRNGIISKQVAIKRAMNEEQLKRQIM